MRRVLKCMKMCPKKMLKKKIKHISKQNILKPRRYLYKANKWIYFEYPWYLQIVIGKHFQCWHWLLVNNLFSGLSPWALPQPHLQPPPASPSHTSSLLQPPPASSSLLQPPPAFLPFVTLSFPTLRTSGVSVCSHPKCLQRPRLGWGEARSPEVSLGLWMAGRDPHHLSHHLLFPRLWNEQKAGTVESQKNLGILVRDVRQ